MSKRFRGAEPVVNFGFKNKLHECNSWRYVH